MVYDHIRGFVESRYQLYPKQIQLDINYGRNEFMVPKKASLKLKRQGAVMVSSLSAFRNGAKKIGKIARVAAVASAAALPFVSSIAMTTVPTSAYAQPVKKVAAVRGSEIGEGVRTKIKTLNSVEEQNRCIRSVKSLEEAQAKCGVTL